MPVDESPSLRQQLGAELRRLRDLAGISGRDLGPKIGISQSSITRIERGERAPSIPEVVAWCSATDADEVMRRHLVTIAEAAKTEDAPWRSALEGRAHMQEDAAKLERSASLIGVCTNDMVPGLLQTADYASALFPIVTPEMAGHDTATAVAARLRRQEVLYDQHKQFEFLITEAVLRWSPAPGVMAAQLAKIKSVATMVNVWVGILPLSAPIGLLHTFHLFGKFEDAEDGEGDPIVTVELPEGRRMLDMPNDVAPYRRIFGRLHSLALSGDAAADLLDRIAAGHRE